MPAHATQDAMVNPTTHGFRRRRASEIAPSRGTERTTSSDEIPLPSAYTVLEAPRSAMIQTEKYSVATFIEKMVFAKSYSAQLARSRRGARADTRIEGVTGKCGSESCMYLSP